MNKEDRRIYTLSTEKPLKAVIKMSVPLIAGMFIMVLYNLVDTYFIGLTHDDYQLAAVNFAYPVMMAMIAISNMVGTGASSFIARCLGADDREKAEHTLTTAMVLTVINGVITSSLGLIFLPLLITLLGARDNTFVYTEQYVLVLLIGDLFTMGNYTLGQLLRSEGSVKYSIAGMIAGTIGNIILGPIFIFSLKLEVRGAAIATILGNAIGMSISLVFYIRGKTLLAPSVKYIIPTREILGEIFRVGVPASMETLLTSVAYMINNGLAVSYGELTVAATGIAQKIMSFGSYIYQGFAAGTQPIMGYNYGAKNYKRMLAVLRTGAAAVSATELAVMAMYGLTAPMLIGIFTSSPEVISTGARVLRTIMFILPFVGAVSMSRMSFQAMGKPIFAFGITLVRQCILYIPLLQILNSAFGLNGMLWAQPVTELIMMAASLILLSSVIRSEKAKYGEPQRG